MIDPRFSRSRLPATLRRWQRGLTRYEYVERYAASQRLGVSQDTYGRWVTGKNYPNPDNLLKIMKELGPDLSQERIRAVVGISQAEHVQHLGLGGYHAAGAPDRLYWEGWTAAGDQERIRIAQDMFLDQTGTEIRIHEILSSRF